MWCPRSIFSHMPYSNLDIRNFLRSPHLPGDFGNPQVKKESKRSHPGGKEGGMRKGGKGGGREGRREEGRDERREVEVQ